MVVCPTVSCWSSSTFKAMIWPSEHAKRWTPKGRARLPTVPLRVISVELWEFSLTSNTQVGSPDLQLWEVRKPLIGFWPRQHPHPLHKLRKCWVFHLWSSGSGFTRLKEARLGLVSAQTADLLCRVWKAMVHSGTGTRYVLFICEMEAMPPSLLCPQLPYPLLPLVSGTLGPRTFF